MNRTVTQMLILWLLSEGPMHGYRIKRTLDEQSLRFWFALEAGSIYTVLATLAKGGYVVEETVEREGKRPERTSYRITKAGREHLRELLKEAWTSLPRLTDPFNVAMAAMSEFTPEEIEGLIADREASLKTRLQTLETVARSAPAEEMGERLRAITGAELKWLRDSRDSLTK